ncbi:hypothetical protein KG759_003716 [Escherichia coli]|nr:hypothetical protein [Escherichia coli]EFP8477479.1 hypothetical protein [Shigella boydii]EKG8124727.1 hypothetical protein [Shigella flexneri]EED0609253.1 hypothetical protein [Escherichia coli]EES2729958.1 hypothetical protein [Escherichia coli]EET7772159.1 hypothetical protein [Escherichia coli]
MSDVVSFQFKDIDEELAKAGMLERMRVIVEMAIEQGLTVTETQFIINNEIAMIEDEIVLFNKKARNEFIRRRLDLDDSDLITRDHEIKAFDVRNLLLDPVPERNQ